MTNRQKLIETNIYDLLCEMNKAITGFKCDCVMEALTGFKIKYSSYCCDSCGECIARWLNEEA
jgi:hypothetical protein